MSNSMDIRQMGLNEAWEVFNTEVQMDEPAYISARFGFSVKFDIYEYLNGYVSIKSKTGKAFIRGKSYKTEELFTEIEMRKRVIKEWLLENFGEESIANPWESTGMVGSNEKRKIGELNGNN